MAINVPIPKRQARSENMNAISNADLSLSNNALHLADVENTLGQSLEMMSRPSAMVNRLEMKLEERKRRREPIENEWLDAYRRYNSEYSPSVKARFKPGKCQIWVGLTHMKVHTAHAAIMDFLDRDSWDLEPQPIPDDATIHPQLQSMGVTLDDIREELRLRTENMKTEITNQLDDADFPENLDLAALECVITGTGALKGPFTVRESGSEWQVGFDANMEAVATEVQRSGFKPDSSYVSVFNVYPDMECQNVQKGDGIFEELYLTRAQMIDLAMQDGFDTISILRILRDYPKGNANIRPEQIELRRISGDADPSASNRYRVVLYHGSVTGDELSYSGVKIEQNMRSLQTIGCIWYCAQYVMKAKQHKGRIPYHIFQYVRRTGFGPYGKGVPILGRTSQDAVNAGARILIDNAGIASGPYVEANMELLAPGEDPTDLHGWKVFQSRHDGNQSKKAISIYNIPAYTDQFIKIIHLFRQLMDEETFQPSLSSGMEGVNTNDTATGMSIMNSNANRSTKKVMKNIDAGGIEPFIEAYYQWNMYYNPKRNILGNMKPVALGAAAAMAQEFQTQRLMQFGQLFQGHPDLKSTDLMRETAQSMDIKPDTVIVSDKEKMGQVAQDQGGNMAQPPVGMPNS